MTEHHPSEAAAPERTRPGELKIFINYRRDDMMGWAQLLYDRLAIRFGADNVFLDVRTLKPGVLWLEEIKTHAGTGAFLALIGPRWQSSMAERRPSEDYVRIEIEYALSRSSNVEVIPLVVGSAVPPTRTGLPTSLHPLTNIQIARLREERVDEDVEVLIARLAEIAAAKRADDVVPAPRLSTPAPAPAPATPTSVAATPPDSHYDLVLRHLIDEGSVVTLLGSTLSRGSRTDGWSEETGAPPDADDLAATLARQLDMVPAPSHLPQVAQYVWETLGKADLYKPLNRVLASALEPGPVHRFLASLPAKLESLGVEPRYQMIVTTNYDMALERAFEAAGEPFDLVMYMASGPDEGRFVHFPYQASTQTAITVPNAYSGLPMDEYGELRRTIIVKINGAADGTMIGVRWRGNYVITEDHYIDYLSRSPVESLVPIQLLDKLRDSHCLFLGYTMCDWSLRVFLKRIWSDTPLGAKSWAVVSSVDALEKEFWMHANVDVYTATAPDYLAGIEERLEARHAADTRR